MAQSEGAILTTRLWNTLAPCPILLCLQLSVRTPISTTLCLIRVFRFNLSMCKILISPRNRPLTRLSIPLLFMARTATCDNAGLLAGVMARSLTPQLCREKRLTMWDNVFDLPLSKIDNTWCTTRPLLPRPIIPYLPCFCELVLGRCVYRY